jgi:xanthine dehydrogenase/oxidase
MIHLDNSYEFPTFHVEGQVCRTNTPSNCAFRAYGAPPAMTITENMLYDACAELGMDPLKFRRDNLQRPGYESHYGQVMEESDVTMTACLDEVVARCDYHNLRQQVEEFNLNNQWRKRGVYLIPNKYGIGLPQTFGQAGALVNVFLDGSVVINHGGVEMGQGLHTKMIQIVASELNIPMDRIRVSASSNDKIPNPIPTGGSTGADLNGNALRDACQQIMARLAPLRAAAEKAPWEMLVQMAFGSRINLSAAGYYGVPDDKSPTFDPVTKKGKRWWYYTIGAACSLVEIDVLTGEHTLLSTELVMDVGQAINPAIDIAQIEAAFIQGYGWVSMENTTFSPEGKLQTRGHGEYNIPTIADCPAKFNVTLLKSERKEHILYSSKGIGEPPFFNGVSAYFAIKEAVRAARRDAGLAGKFQLKQPTIPEHVLAACARSPLA